MVHPLLSFAHAHESAIIALIRGFVECESPSDDPAAVNRFVECVADTLAPFGSPRTHSGGRFGKHLTCEMRLPGRKKTDRILVLGHCDTVWPVGTLRAMPFRHEQGRLWGPGVFDMKAGIAFFLFAVKALRELDIPVPSRILLQLNSDEEVGSESSRPLTEKNAAGSKAVLVLEPASGLEGKLKTARKGVGEMHITVRGKASHSGLDFEAGASAVLELARQVERIARFTQIKRGITVNPGVISGGTRSNVVAAEARAVIDLRVVRARDGTALEKKFHALRPFDRRCSLEITGGLNRPPMERTAGTVRLLRIAQQAGRELGMVIGESRSGGGSDGNFTSAIGVPTLDGLGAVGEGAHAAHESILVNRIAPRTALLTKLLAMTGLLN